MIVNIKFKISENHYLIHVSCAIFFLILFFATGQITAQKYRFENLTSADGLSQNMIYVVFQDSRKFLWIGTSSGLNKYDGSTFKIFKYNPNDPKSIGGVHFRAIVEDKEGNLWIASNGGGLSKYLRATEEFLRFRNDPLDSNSISGNRITSLVFDNYGYLWIGTETGLCKMNIYSQKIIRIKANDSVHKNILSAQVNALYKDSNGKIWIGTSNGITILNPENNSFSDCPLDNGKPSQANTKYIYRFYEDRSKNVWIGTKEGLYLFHRKEKYFSSFLADLNKSTSLSSNAVRDILEDRHGNIWIATNSGGLNLYDRDKNIFHRFTNNPMDPMSISSDNIFCLREDESGILWIGTYGGGLNKLNFRKSQIFYYRNQPETINSLSSNRVSCLYVDEDNSIWIGTLSGGLNHLVRKSEQSVFTRYKSNVNNPIGVQSDEQILSIQKDKQNNLWLGVFGGLKTLKNGSTSIGPGPKYTNENALGFSVFAVLLDNSDQIWIGSYRGGLTSYNMKTNQSVNYLHNPQNSNSIISNVVRYLYRDSRGIIWICTEEGLDAFDPVTKQFTHFKQNPGGVNNIPDNLVLVVYEDSKNNIWVGTASGLCKIEAGIIDPAKIKITHYNITNGLPNNSIQGIQEDSHGNLWIGTLKGISKFSVEKQTFKNYDVNDGLLSNEIYVTAAAKISKTGELIFGGDKGFFIFHPDSLTDDPYNPTAVLTGLSISNKEVPVNTEVDGNILLPKVINETKEINLSYKQNSIFIEFTGLYYANPNENLFRYKMDGLDEDWIYLGKRKNVSFVNLSPGDYTFRLSVANHSGNWSKNEAFLHIKISPPFYNIFLFRVITLIVLISGAVFLVRRKTNSIKKRSKELLDEVDRQTRELRIAKERAEEADKSKSDFLANTSHELRTPLNAILGYAQILRRQPDIKEKHKEQLLTIQKSGEHLLNLINDILDLRRIEVRGEEISKLEFNLRSMINEVMSTVRLGAINKDLTLNYYEKTQLPEIVVGDTKKIRQILLNLLGNAIKYTNKGFIKLEVGVSDVSLDSNGENKTRLAFIISDSGVGIAKTRFEEIFQPFSQKETTKQSVESSGLGLAISKKLAELMGGKLSVKSELGKGTSFTLEIELETRVGDNELKTEYEKMIIGFEGPIKKILIVDDNPLNTNLFVSLLEPLGFSVASAEDGKVALSMLPVFEPNLILLDLLMPEVDGLDLIQLIEIEQRSHKIKILGVSAAVADNKRTDVFSKACDDFISKPINAELLLEKIGKLLNINWIEETTNMLTGDIRKITMIDESLISKPATDILDSITRYANIGDYSSINQIIKNLIEENDYPDFCNKILEYSKRFDDESIITFCK